MNPTVLIGLDGASFSVLDPLIEDGVMPSLGQLASRGVRAELRSTVHPLTAQAWPALMTGRTPGSHGVFDFVRVQRAADHPTYTLSSSQDLRCETVWSIVGRQGGRVLCLNFPLMFPPQPIRGAMVPGFVPWRHLRRAVAPPELYERLKAMPGFDPTELALDYDLEKRAIQSLPSREYEDWIRLHTRREHQWFEIARTLMSEQQFDLVAVLFDGVDKLQHVCWPFLDPELVPAISSSWERTVRDLCLDYFRRLDGLIGEIVARAGPEARVFVASDHGFGPTDMIFYVNEWLAHRGYLAWRADAQVDRDGMLHADGHRSTVVLFDWARTTACALTPSSNGIFIQVRSHPGGPGVPPTEYDSFRRGLIESLMAFREPEHGSAVVKQVLTREEAYPGPRMGQAPDLTLVLRDHGFVSVLRAAQPVRRRARVEGTHRPEGVFLAAGEGIRRGAPLPSLSIVDVAPALLYSLGLPIPVDLEGRLPIEAFDPGLLDARPPRLGPPTEAPLANAAEGEGRAAGEGLVLERLRALGYLE